MHVAAPVAASRCAIPSGSPSSTSSIAARPWRRIWRRACASFASGSRPRITKQELAKHVGPGDLIVDLAWNIDCAALLDFCRRNDVLYINTSVEVWNPYAGIETTSPPERTLYARHMALRKMIAGWPAESRRDGGSRSRGQPRPGVALHEDGADRHRPADHRRNAR